MAKAATAKRSFKLDLMVLLEAIDKKDRGFYANLTEEERKGFVPKVVVRWLSAVPDSNPYKEYFVLAANDLVNNGLWNLGKHPELQYLLMCVAGVGKKQYHQWISTKSTASKTPKTEALLTQLYGDVNEAEMMILKTNHSDEELMEIAKYSGMDDRGIKELKDELKKAAKGD
jgi:hypothetical protein